MVRNIKGQGMGRILLLFSVFFVCERVLSAQLPELASLIGDVGLPADTHQHRVRQETGDAFWHLMWSCVFPLKLQDGFL